mmetsp:Transcript_74442/g.134169  ORF Transcript_74442/g.134169 Transcript_74442/m.134169 type:complete len:214 (-) Transcript_74442:50-691(-)
MVPTAPTSCLSLRTDLQTAPASIAALTSAALAAADSAFARFSGGSAGAEAEAKAMEALGKSPCPRPSHSQEAGRGGAADGFFRSGARCSRPEDSGDRLTEDVDAPPTASASIMGLEPPQPLQRDEIGTAIGRLPRMNTLWMTSRGVSRAAGLPAASSSSRTSANTPPHLSSAGAEESRILASSPPRGASSHLGSHASAEKPENVKHEMLEKKK